MRIRILDPIGCSEAYPEFILIEDASKPTGTHAIGEYIYLDLKKETKKEEAEILVELMRKHIDNIYSSDRGRNIFARK